MDNRGPLKTVVFRWRWLRASFPSPSGGGCRPAELLIPANTWEDKAAYEASCKKLAKSFTENFKKYTHMSPEVVAAGPKA